MSKKLPLKHRVVDAVCCQITRLFNKPYTRIMYFGNSYMIIIVRSQEEYTFSFALKKPMSDDHQVFLISKTPYPVPEWIGRDMN